MDDKISKKSIKERLEDLKKAMNQKGLGGPGSVKAGAVLPSINKLPKPGNNSLSSKMGMPGIKQGSKKNPIKSAEQTQNKDIKDLKMKEAQNALKAKAPEMVKFEKNGQWSIQKMSNPANVNYDHAPDNIIDGATVNEVEDRGADVNLANVHRPGAEVTKSGYKGYKPEDNARRKAGNLTTETGVKGMPRVKNYGNSASVASSRIAAKDKAKSKKNPVKVITGADIPRELKDKYEKKGKYNPPS